MTSRSRQIVAASGALAVAVGVVLAVVALGTLPVPDFPTLEERPDPAFPGIIAYARHPGLRTCLHTVESAAGEREVTCLDVHSELLGWTPDGHLVLQRLEPGQRVLVVDPRSGRILRRAPAHHPEPRPGQEGHPRVREDGSELATHEDRGPAEVVVLPPDGPARTLLSVEGSRDYRFWHAQWSPDGEWVLVSDSIDRLLLLKAAGDPVPRVLATDAGEPTWYIPGHTRGTLRVRSRDGPALPPGA